VNYRMANVGLYLMAFVAVADQISKIVILTVFNHNGCPVTPQLARPITEFFNLVLHCNRGVTFGLFNNGQDLSPYIFVAVAMVIMGLLVAWLFRATSYLTVVGLGMVLGGAVGNVIDRLQHGGVVDFLDFHAFGYHWPAFNVADAAIVCGVTMLFIENLVHPQKTR